MARMNDSSKDLRFHAKVPVGYHSGMVAKWDFAFWT